MKQLHVEQLAQIRKADVEFGDITLLVGPQASGKSVFLQLLVKDHGPITKTLKRYGYSYEPGTTESTSDPLLTLRRSSPYC
jgi:ABC-type multidrug transport system ATPase subunit